MNKMKLFAFSTLLLVAPLASCKALDYSYNKKISGNDVKSVSFDLTYVKLEVGESIQLEPIIEYYDDIEVKIYTEWRTSDEKVATVDNGFVSAVGGGRCHITFLAGTTKAAVCEIEVPKHDEQTPDPIPGEFTIRLNESRKDLVFRQTFQLIATTSEDAEVSWAVTSGEGIVTVDNAGLVTAGAVEGRAVVTATANNRSAHCTFDVAPEGGDDEDDKIINVFFFLDYNSVDEEDTTGTRLLANFMWYPDRPVGQSGLVPATPTTAPTSDFPHFIGWSNKAIIDSASELIDVETYVTGDLKDFAYIFGIWSDVPKGEF